MIDTDPFPITWDDPGDAERTWVRDRMHTPGQVPPLEYAWSTVTWEPGMASAQAELLNPLRLSSRLVNGYHYRCIEPGPAADDARRRRVDLIEERMADSERAWSEDHLPEILEHLAWWDEFDLRGASTTDLLDHLDASVERHRRLMHIHFVINPPGYYAMSEFDELYRRLFPDGAALDAFTLLQGLPNLTVEIALRAWDLSRRARTVTAVAGVVASDAAAADKATALGASPEGRRFLDAIDEYLRVYGKRSDGWTTTSPSWIEDPSPVYSRLRDFVRRDDDDSPALDLERLATERERATAAALERLDGHPERARFEHLLACARFGAILSEDHNFYIDFGARYEVRRLLIEFGRRFADVGVLEDTDDVFYLDLDELRATASERTDRRALVGERCEFYTRWADVDAPDVIGAPMGAPSPDDPFARTQRKFQGLGAAAGDGEVRGHPGSPGTVRGRARVVATLAEADSLEPGDVLVAPTTAPPWTPLFAIAGAVVTDTGGVLSHCAVVAREYGIPAVVGARGATATLVDGSTVEVDGDAGVVRVVDAP